MQTKSAMWRVYVRQAPKAVLLAWFVIANIRWSFPRGALNDLGSFVASGRAALAGQDPYGVYEGTVLGVFSGTSYACPNLNPPVSVLACEGLARLEPHWLANAWYVVSGILYLITLLLLMRVYRPQSFLRPIWAFSLVGLWTTLAIGQIYMPFVLATAGAWLLLKRGRPIAAGILIGIVTAIKPNFALWPILLLAAGHWASALAAGASAGALSLLPLLVYGPHIYEQWLAASAGSEVLVRLPGNASLAGVGARLGLPWLGTALAAGLVLALALWAWRRRFDALTASGLALVASLLASPIAWIAYTLFLLPVILARPRWHPALLAGAALLMVPMVPFWSLCETSTAWLILVGSLYAWALLLILSALVREAACALPAGRLRA